MNRLAALLGAMFAALPGLAGHGVSVNPLDDDAGSGGDAGDAPVTALPIGPGSYGARLTPPQDLTDYYRFDATAGQAIRIRLDAGDGPSLFLLRSDPLSPNPLDGAFFGGLDDVADEELFLLPYDGPWYLRALGAGDYAFTFALEAPAVAFHAALTTEDWATLEVAWPAGAEGSLVMSAIPAVDAVGEDSGMAMMESLRDDGRLGWIGLTWTGHGTGNTIVADPLLPPTELPAQAAIDPNVGGGVWTTFDGEPGTRRATLYHTAAVSRLEVTIAATTDIELHSALGDGFVLHRDADGGADVQVQVPGASASTAKRFDLDVQGHFVGTVVGHGYGVVVTSPAGTPYGMNPLSGSRPLVGPSPGRWTVDVPPTAGAGPGVSAWAVVGTVHAPGADKTYLHGVEVPTFGLLPSDPYPE